jgi:hypothetical protein
MSPSRRSRPMACGSPSFQKGLWPFVALIRQTRLCSPVPRVAPFPSFPRTGTGSLLRGPQAPKDRHRGRRSIRAVRCRCFFGGNLGFRRQHRCCAKRKQSRKSLPVKQTDLVGIGPHTEQVKGLISSSSPDRGSEGFKNHNVHLGRSVL